MSYLERISALALGRYADGPPARPVSVGPFAADPAEVLIDNRVEATTDPGAVGSTQMPQGPDLGPDSQPKYAEPVVETPTEVPETGDPGHTATVPDPGATASRQISPSPEVETNSGLARTDVESEPQAGIPGDVLIGQDKAKPVAGNPPYLSYAEALLQNPVAQEANADAQAPKSVDPGVLVGGEPVAPGHKEGDLLAPMIETLSEPQLPHEMGTQGGDKQAPKGGVEIGELTIRVEAPQPTQAPTVRPRGVPISPGAALRRAGIRRL